MKIIAVDPGYDRLGIAILEKSFEPGSRSGERLLFSETFETEKKAELRDRIYTVGQRIRELCRKYEVEYLAIEKLFFTNNQKTAMGVSEARGVIIYVAQEAGAKIEEYTPLQIKVAVTGNGRADKKSVIDMTRRLVTVPNDVKKLDDEYDAIACGLCFFAHFRLARAK